MAAMVIAPVQSASAYPPGTAMTVSAAPNPVVVRQHFTATASNVKPGCRVEFKFGDREVKVTATGGTASATFVAPKNRGNYRLTARCSHGESAGTTVHVVGSGGNTGPGQVTGPEHVCRDARFTIKVTNFAPNSRVIVVIRKSNGGSNGHSTTYSQSARTGNAGAASYRFKVDRTGVYLVSAVAEGKRAATAISVDRC